MIVTSHSQPEHSLKFQNFLEQKIGLTENALNLGIRQAQLEQAPLAIVLWSFGLLTLEQYQQVLDWQDHNLDSN